MPGAAPHHGRLDRLIRRRKARGGGRPATRTIECISWDRLERTRQRRHPALKPDAATALGRLRATTARRRLHPCPRSLWRVLQPVQQRRRRVAIHRHARDALELADSIAVCGPIRHRPRRADNPGGSVAVCTAAVRPGSGGGGGGGACDHHRPVARHHVALRIHALREGVIVLLLDAHLRRRTACPRRSPCRRAGAAGSADRGAAPAADRSAQARRQARCVSAAAPTAWLLAVCA